jgi:transposase
VRIGSSAVQAEANAAIVHTGSAGGQRSVGRGRFSLCTPWGELIRQKLEAGLSAQRIYQDLVAEQGFVGSYHSVRRYVRRLAQARALPFRRLECGPGEEAQVDFGRGIPITTSAGHRRQTHVFRIILSHSRKGYSEAVYRQTTPEFLRCLENAFVYFGGAPQTLVLDNLKAAVQTPDWFDPELHPQLRSFAEHYGIAIMPTRPRMPRHKGKIESGIGYVKKNALRGHTFTSLDEENQHLQHWEETVADTRVHGTTRQQVGKVFESVERRALRPLPSERFAFFRAPLGGLCVEGVGFSVPEGHVVNLAFGRRWQLGRLPEHFLNFGVIRRGTEQLGIQLRGMPGSISQRPERRIRRGQRARIGRMDHCVDSYQSMPGLRVSTSHR